ncbi:putative membrane protein, TIGR04086 family [Desulfofundulus australicus DSM 11792]|uniref:Putative membrane protein, TIGR04086 family n=1 Tax=Desulfofundulus australicus DSM 11792 TaxID=1121425 RepID=A0A1M5C6I4_9FIRM|nr:MULTISPECIES: TIGR04086 family membrane protein [Desulfofundulus]SHF50290.1 putative membrane protein, TIGR04086 family [Desulfofundulus australicus DSM 11792]
MINNETSGSFNIGEVFRGTLLGLAVSFLGSALIGTGYYFTRLPESSLPWFAAGLFFLSILIGACSAASRAGNRGLFHGLGVALLFFIISWLLASILFPSPILPVSLIQKLILAIVAGALGGILGVGFSDQD